MFQLKSLLLVLIGLVSCLLLYEIFNFFDLLDENIYSDELFKSSNTIDISNNIWSDKTNINLRNLEKNGDSHQHNIHDQLIHHLDIAGVNEEDIQSSIPCLNTVQGIHYITDNRGYTCDREDLNADTNCCNVKRSLHRFTCHSCEDSCCAEYETCVSCCLSKKQDRLIYQDNEDGIFNEKEFNQCLDICRTSSKSIIHGNQYKANIMHHCFKEYPAYNPYESHDANYKAGTMMISEKNENCNDACQRYNKLSQQSYSCIDTLLEDFNDCDILSSYFDCNQCHEKSYNYAPAYIDDTCVINKDLSSSKCSSSNKNAARLCICMPKL